MRTIYRYVLGKQTTFHCAPTSNVAVSIPIGAKILAPRLVGDELSIFAIVDTIRDSELRMFRVIGTGQDAEILSYEDEYIGSISVLNGTYMYHIFDAGTLDRNEEQQNGNEQSARPDNGIVARL